MKRVLLPLLLSAASLVAAGCASHVAYAGYYGPPTPIVESYGYAPGPGYVWVPGYYVWGGGRYSWVGGRWTLPPHPHAVWVKGHYVRREGHAEYTGGHWR